MSAVLQFEFRLFGARKGQTIWLNNHLFQNGICLLVQSSDNMGTAARVLSFYGAYHRGSQEYDAALAKEQAEEAKANGADEVPEAPLAGVDPAVEANLQSPGGGSPKGEAVSSAVDAGPGGTDPASLGSSGDGHEHAGIPKFPEEADYRAEEPSSSVNEAVAAAVRKLDFHRGPRRRLRPGRVRHGCCRRNRLVRESGRPGELRDGERHRHRNSGLCCGHRR